MEKIALSKDTTKLSRLSRIKDQYHNLPKDFWVLMGATFVDRLGGFLLFPFFALYITIHFNVAMTEVGFLFMSFSIGNILGNIIGGALSDKIGRRLVLLFGLVVSGLGSVAMAYVNDLIVFYTLAFALGILGEIAGPARQAMVVDLVSIEHQAEAFGVMRVIINIAATVGPVLGGLLASKSFFYLFYADAVSSLITAIIVFLVIPETKPQLEEGKKEESIKETFLGYKTVLKDSLFMSFILLSMLMILVYMQMYSTLSVYLRDYKNFTPELIGWLLSLNAAMVVLFQISITKRLSDKQPFLVMALGNLFYGIGFGMFGFVSSVYLIFSAMAILTIGEMIVSPAAQSITARFASKEKRGRYLAVFGFSWSLPNIFGVLIAGLIMDNFNPNWVWYGSAILSIITIIGFIILHEKGKERMALKKEELDKEIAISIENHKNSKNNKHQE